MTGYGHVTHAALWHIAVGCEWRLWQPYTASWRGSGPESWWLPREMREMALLALRDGGDRNAWRYL